MRTLIASMTAALLMTAGAAYAEDVNGVVATFEEGVITLEDGTMYTVPEGVEVGDLEAGANVMISFEKNGEENDVTAVTAAE